MANQPDGPQRTSEMRILVGLALQPFVTAGVAFMLFPVLLLDRTGQALGGGVPGDVTQAAASVAVTVGLASVPLAMVGALPMFLWLTRRGRVTLPRALMAGVAVGNVPIVVGSLLAGAYGPIETARTITYASAIGLTGAAVFWLVVSPTRDERQA